MQERSLVSRAKKVYGTRDTIDEIQRQGSLRVMVDFTPPPWEGPPPEFYLDPRNHNRPSGIACELGYLMAKDLGVQVDWVDIPWKDQLEAFLEGEAHLLPKHTNTPLRGLLVDFSSESLQSIEVVAVVARDGPFKKKEDLAGKEVTIGVWQGSSNLEVARRHFPQAQIIEARNLWNEMTSGHCEAIITDGVTQVALERFSAYDLIRKETGEREILSLEYGYPAVFPGDGRFLNFLNNFMRYQKITGTLQYWTQTWWLEWMAR